MLPVPTESLQLFHASVIAGLLQQPWRLGQETPQKLQAIYPGINSGNIKPPISPTVGRWGLIPEAVI